MIYETRITSVTVTPKGEPIFSECATTVRIEDDAAGEFVEVDQSGNVELGKIQISAEEWPTLRAAIDDMISKCRDNGKGGFKSEVQQTDYAVVTAP